MVFIKKVLLLCCLPILLAIVMPINCNKFNSQIDQSLKRFARQVNANNDQQIGANETHSLENFGMHDKSSGPLILPGRNNERRGRQLNIYSPAQGYNDYASQPWYLANKEYYDNYYANYYQRYYQTSTEPYRQQNYQSYPSQVASRTSQSNIQYPNVATASLNLGQDGDSVIYIDENGIFQIGKSDSLNAVSPLVGDDAIVFQSDESQYDRRTYSLNKNSGRQSRLDDDADSNSKVDSFNGLPVFSD